MADTFKECAEARTQWDTYVQGEGQEFVNRIAERAMMFIEVMGLNTTSPSDPATTIQLDLELLQEFDVLRHSVNMDEVYIFYLDADLNPGSISTAEQIQRGMPYHQYQPINPPTPSGLLTHSDGNLNSLVNLAPESIRTNLDQMSNEEQRTLLEELLTSEQGPVQDSPNWSIRKQSLVDSVQSSGSNLFVGNNAPLQRMMDWPRELPNVTNNDNISVPREQIN
ncbi:hypothetical protein BT96DRAFT_936322 [Gymnopus androsaceus JB14]|uniref:Uncharacterized protein n=1 Tax=Gymnopus androsaceus JB14 TaxID=1447944 RepID=A0A6A4HY30_9AGAR|nr:hypothetical protein BT96DRAFT_936322 [Gymnopus androsaceus JB14]